MSRYRHNPRESYFGAPDFGAPDFGASLGLVFSMLHAARQPRRPRILTAEQLERQAKEDERAAWNREVEERKAAKRATKEAA